MVFRIWRHCLIFNRTLVVFSSFVLSFANSILYFKNFSVSLNRLFAFCSKSVHIKKERASGEENSRRPKYSRRTSPPACAVGYGGEARKQKKRLPGHRQSQGPS